MPNQAQHNMDNINIGGWVDKSKGINYEGVSIWHKEKWKRGGMFENGSAELIPNFKYQLEERREKRGYYRY